MQTKMYIHHVNEDKTGFMSFNQNQSSDITQRDDSSETSGQNHLPWKQCLIYGK